MAKRKKLPKQPKHSSSLETWKSWQRRCDEVLKFNEAIYRAANEKRKIKQTIQQRAAKLR